MNTNIKHRYTDALAAAWMAKHQGMVFKSGHGSVLYYDGGSDFRVKNTSGVYAGEYYYIHRDSLNLLEPKAGDLVEFDGIIHGLVLDVNNDETAVQCDDIVYTPATSKCTIIQRNGKAFMSPESEAV